MAGYTPPGVPDDTVLRLGIAALGVLLFGLIFGQARPVAGALLVVVSVYVVWRFLRALEAIADGTHRLAAARERETDGGAGDRSGVPVDDD